MRLHHIGIAVYNFETVVPFYESQGYQKETEIYDPEQNVKVCVLGHPTLMCIELLSPYDEKSPINNILKKSGVTPYHLCYEVDDINVSFTELKRQKFMPVSKIKVSNAFDNHKVCFFLKKDIGLIEIIEK